MDTNTILICACLFAALVNGQCPVTEVYWSNGWQPSFGFPGSVNHVNTDGTGRVALVTGLQTVDDVEIDTLNGHLYYNQWRRPVNTPSGPPGAALEALYRCQLNGTGIVSLPTVGTHNSCNGFPSGLHGISLDVANRVLYFTRGVSYADCNGPEVSKVNFDGTGYLRLNGPGQDGWYLNGVDVDVANGIVYWGSPGVITGTLDGAVNRATTSGTMRARVAPHTYGLGESLALHAASGTVFFASWDYNGFMGPFVEEIWSIKVDGTGLVKLPIVGLTGVTDIEVDSVNQRIWFTDFLSGTVQSAAFNGTGLRTEITGLAFPLGLALVQRSVITCPAPIAAVSAPGVCGAVAVFATPVGCPGATTTQTGGLPSGATFPVGTTTNAFTATDTSGSTSSCSFTVTVAPCADLSITKSGGGSNVAGYVRTYRLVVRNTPLSGTASALVTDTFDTTLLRACAWSCGASTGSSCGATSSGVGSISQTINVLAGGEVTFDVSCVNVACAVVMNTATVGAIGVTDPNPGNNIATLTTAAAADGVSCIDNLTTNDRDTCFAGLCVSCPDIERCPSANAITIQFGNGTRVCGTTSTTYKPNGDVDKFSITGWSPLTAVTNVFGQSVNLNDYVGDYAIAEANGVRTLTCVGGTCDTYPGGRAIVFSNAGVAACYVQFIVDDGARKRAPLVTTFGGSHLFPLVANAIGDPHIVGPNGEKFDWVGQPGHVYALFQSPLIQVNVLMSKETATNAGHFMTKVAVHYRDVTITTDLTLHQSLYKQAIERVDEQLKPLDGRATLVQANKLQPAQLVLDLCAGHRIVITRHVPSSMQNAQLHLYETVEFYDVEIEVPGCHDEFDGVVGQLYQCKYESGVKFEWNQNNVENYRVSSLASTGSSFSHRAPCLEREHFGYKTGSLTAVH